MEFHSIYNQGSFTFSNILKKISKSSFLFQVSTGRVSFFRFVPQHSKPKCVCFFLVLFLFLFYIVSQILSYCFQGGITGFTMAQDFFQVIQRRSYHYTRAYQRIPKQHSMTSTTVLHISSNGIDFGGTKIANKELQEPRGGIHCLTNLKVLLLTLPQHSRMEMVGKRH